MKFNYLKLGLAVLTLGMVAGVQASECNFSSHVDEAMTLFLNLADTKAKSNLKADCRRIIALLENDPEYADIVSHLRQALDAKASQALMIFKNAGKSLPAEAQQYLRCHKVTLALESSKVAQLQLLSKFSNNWK